MLGRSDFEFFGFFDDFLQYLVIDGCIDNGTRACGAFLPLETKCSLHYAFGCQFEVGLSVENSQSIFTARYAKGERISFPVAHHDGNYTADAATLDRLEGEGRVAFRYAEAVNGSARAIAGILNDAGNVLGMMPHPERVIEAAHGNEDGRRLFEGLLETVG